MWSPASSLLALGDEDKNHLQVIAKLFGTTPAPFRALQDLLLLPSRVDARPRTSAKSALFCL